MSELKTCPFCGGEPELTKATSMNYYTLWCKNPNCYAGSVEVNSFNVQQLVDAWNTRAPIPTSGFHELIGWS